MQLLVHSSDDDESKQSLVLAKDGAELCGSGRTCSEQLGLVKDATEWAEFLVNKSLMKISQLKNQYIVLEDLTCGFKRPCVLDLKLGTRQHGLNASETKIKSKTAKVNSTTSKTLGLRLCGMQVYKPYQSESVFRDKYFGRKLDDTSFEENLKSFFDNGLHLRTDAIRTIIKRLELLFDVLSTQSKFLFYATSILLVYEGHVEKDFLAGKSLSTSSSADSGVFPSGGSLDMDHDPSPDEDSSRSAQMHLIDFAHTYPLYDGEIDSDSGVVFGVNSLLRLLRKFLEEDSVDVGSSGTSET